jgi:hypothetical protein
MMRATGAKLRMLASAAAEVADLGVVCGGEELDCGDADDMARLQGGRLLVHRLGTEVIRRADEADARLAGMRASSEAVSGQADDLQTGARARTNQRAEGRREIDPPLAIGSHRSCSLTSNSYPSPCACVS